MCEVSFEKIKKNLNQEEIHPVKTLMIRTTDLNGKL